MREFTYQALPIRVVFGNGSSSALASEIRTLGLKRVLVICSPAQKELGDQIVTALGDLAAGLLPDARMHVPAELARHARDVAAAADADGCVAVGGGSAIGLGKAIALRHALPIVAVPTTYAGSEMTPIWGLTEDGVKRTGRDERVLPRSVVYDPALTLTLPVSLSVTSGMNAIAHAVEALYAPDVSPIVAMHAEEGARALAGALPRIVADSQDLDARGDAQYGAWLCGACLGATTMSLHHKLCHTLGGTLNLPHAETHTVVLPYAFAYNAAAAPSAAQAMGRALASADPVLALEALARSMGAPRSLREIGMNESDIPRIAELAVRSAYANPRPITRDAVERLLRAAWAGESVSAIANVHA